MDVSIIIPYDKDRGYLRESLESCFMQRFTGTFEVIPFKGNQIQSKNVNQALFLATGEFIKIHHEDDILLPDCIQILWDNIKDADFICANAINFLGKVRHVVKSSRPIDLHTLALDNTIHGGTVLYRRSSLDRAMVNGQVYREDLWTGEEYELHLRMIKAGMKLRYIDKEVSKCRIHSEQKSIGRHDSKYIDDRYDMILAIKHEYDTP